MRRNEDISVLARAVAGYLHANPQASDTCDGVLGWWLGLESGATWQQVQSALDTLVDLGVVVRTEAADGRVRYRCASADAATLARLAQIRDGEQNEMKGST